MALVKFAFICDLCGVRGQEYESYPHCIKCHSDVCPECFVEGSYDEESMTAICELCGGSPVTDKAMVKGDEIEGGRGK